MNSGCTSWSVNTVRHVGNKDLDVGQTSERAHRLRTIGVGFGFVEQESHVVVGHMLGIGSLQLTQRRVVGHEQGEGFHLGEERHVDKQENITYLHNMRQPGFKEWESCVNRAVAVRKQPAKVEKTAGRNVVTFPRRLKEI